MSFVTTTSSATLAALAYSQSVQECASAGICVSFLVHLVSVCVVCSLLVRDKNVSQSPSFKCSPCHPHKWVVNGDTYNVIRSLLLGPFCDVFYSVCIVVPVTKL